jgi:hypothetical protein
MKNTAYFFVILFFTVAFSACQEDGIVFPSVQNSESSFEVIIDGELFSTENVSFTTDNEGIFINAEIVETEEIITLKIDDFDVGVFSFEGENNVASYVKNNMGSEDVWSTVGASSSRGSAEFTHINFVKNTVSGTFNFIGENLSSGSRKPFISGIFNNVPKGI